VLQFIYTYAPFMNTLFHTAPISFRDWLFCLGVGALIYVVIESEKWVLNRFVFAQTDTPT
jgi:cation-transporting ATPase F